MINKKEEETREKRNKQTNKISNQLLFRQIYRVRKTSSIAYISLFCFLFSALIESKKNCYLVVKDPTYYFTYYTLLPHEHNNFNFIFIFFLFSR